MPLPSHVFAERADTHVRVVDGLDADAVEDGLVVGPGGVRDEDLLLLDETSVLRVVVELAQEDTAQVVGTSTTDRLHRGHAVLRDGKRVPSENELGGRGSELGETSDGKVLVVDALVGDEGSLGLMVGRKRSKGVSEDSNQDGSREQCLDGWGPALTRRTHLLDRRQDPRLAVVISVCANAQVDLFVVRVSLVGGGQLEDAASWGKRRR